MNKSLKKFFLFLSSVFIFLIHLLFVFAKTRPYEKSAHGVSPVPSKVSGNNEGKPTNSNVSGAYDSLHLNILGLTKQAFDYAIKGFNSLRSMGKLSNDSVISIIDFSLSSGKKRLFVIDIKNYKILYNTYVALAAIREPNMQKNFPMTLKVLKAAWAFI